MEPTVSLRRFSLRHGSRGRVVLAMASRSVAGARPLCPLLSRSLFLRKKPPRILQAPLARLLRGLVVVFAQNVRTADRTPLVPLEKTSSVTIGCARRKFSLLLVHSRQLLVILGQRRLFQPTLFRHELAHVVRILPDLRHQAAVSQRQIPAGVLRHRHSVIAKAR